jgi:hypothetical protein
MALSFLKTIHPIIIVDSAVWRMVLFEILYKYERHLESKERFAIKNYLLIIGKKKNMQVLSHTFTYFST